MKSMFRIKIFGVTLFLLYSTFLFAQAPDTLWTKTYGGKTGSDYGFSVQQTTDGGYIVAGSTNSFGVGSYDVWLVKTDANGDTLWTRTYGGEFWDDSWTVQQTRDGGYIISGWSYLSNEYYDDDLYLIRTDENGDTLWTKLYGKRFRHNYGRTVQETSDNGFIITGNIDPFGSLSYDIWLVKTDSNGDTLWTKIFGETGTNEMGRSALQTSDNGYIVAGNKQPRIGETLDIWLIKTDENGDTLWTKTYGGETCDEVWSMQHTSDNGYVLVGYTESFGGSGYDAYLIKTDEKGDTLWTKTYGGTGSDFGISVQQTIDGGYIFVGRTNSFGAGNYDLWVVRTDEKGDTLWTKTYGGEWGDMGFSVQTLDNGYIVTGFTGSFGPGKDDLWLLRIKGDVIMGDFNLDGYVDLIDLHLFGDHWHFTDTDPGWDPLYNLDTTPDSQNQQIINFADLQVFGNHWHEGTPPVSKVATKDGMCPNEGAGIVFDLDATTYGNQNMTSIPSQTIGANIRVDVYCSGVHNLDTYEFEVIYDPTELAFVGAYPTNPITYEENILTSNGGEAIGWMVDSSIPGILSLAYTLAGTSSSEAPEGEGLIADIVFQTLITMQDSLTFENVHFCDSFGEIDVIADKGTAILIVDNNESKAIFKENRLENYPNPFRTQTTISYAIKGRLKAEKLDIKIYNLRGQLIESIKAKNGTAIWDASKLPAGIYFSKISYGETSKINKMLLIK